MKGSLLRLDWATSDQVDVSRREFADGKPFPHMIIQDFVRDGKKLDQIQVAQTVVHLVVRLPNESCLGGAHGGDLL